MSFEDLTAGVPTAVVGVRSVHGAANLRGEADVMARKETMKRVERIIFR